MTGAVLSMLSGAMIAAGLVLGVYGLKRRPVPPPGPRRPAPAWVGWLVRMPAWQRWSLLAAPGEFATSETERRRTRQIAFNTEHGITPVSVVKRVKDILEGVYGEARDAPVEASAVASTNYAAMDEKALAKAIRQLEKTMQTHARNLEFEQAAALRDELFRLRAQAFGADQHGTSDQE